MAKELKRCTRCIMDNNSDDTIVFDENGVCNYCKEALERKEKEYFPNELGKEKLNELLKQVKKDGEGKKYDCIMGISGGLDSSYLAYLGFKWGLRVLAVHIDDGYDTDISKNNIRKLVAKTGFDFEVITPDSEQYNALTLSFMKAGVPNIAVPQDNILVAYLYKQMKKHKIKYFFSGYNFALESILQKGNSYKNSDVRNIKDIHKKYYVSKIDKLEFISSTKKLIDKKIHGLKTVFALNYVDYNRDRAFKELKDFCGFEYYGRKHLENILTAFIQLYWLPKKFNFVKRTSHLSSMIVSDQMTREEALKEYNEPVCDNRLMEEYICIIKKNMNLSDDDFEKIMASPNHQHTDFKTEDKLLHYRLIEFLSRGKKAKRK